jgi:general secretion pathway protein A
VLIVDEAQALSAELLELLRLLTNLETQERKLLQIVLIGQPELRDQLARPELEQLSQRVIARVHLGPLQPPRRPTTCATAWRVAGLRGEQPFTRPRAGTGAPAQRRRAAAHQPAVPARAAGRLCQGTRASGRPSCAGGARGLRGPASRSLRPGTGRWLLLLVVAGGAAAWWWQAGVTPERGGDGKDRGIGGRPGIAGSCPRGAGAPRWPALPP